MLLNKFQATDKIINYGMLWTALQVSTMTNLQAMFPISLHHWCFLLPLALEPYTFCRRNKTPLTVLHNKWNGAHNSNYQLERRLGYGWRKGG
jgi:hypothetical protein